MIFSPIVMRLAPYLIGGAVAVGALVFTYHWGWSARGDREARLQAEADAAWRKQLDAVRADADKIAVELDREKQNIKTVTVEVIKTVPKVTKVYVEKPGDAPQPIPSCVYTNGFVGVWNYALSGTSLPGAASDTADTSGGADITRSAVDTPDVLVNAADNFARYAQCRASLNALIDWHRATADRLRGGSGAVGR